MSINLLLWYFFHWNTHIRARFHGKKWINHSKILYARPINSYQGKYIPFYIHIYITKFDFIFYLDSYSLIALPKYCMFKCITLLITVITFHMTFLSQTSLCWFWTGQASTCGHYHGSRRPRQDHITRCLTQIQHCRQRVWWNHPTHWGIFRWWILMFTIQFLCWERFYLIFLTEKS